MEPQDFDPDVLEPEPEPKLKRKNQEYYLQPEPSRRRRWPWFVLGGCVMLCCLCLVVPLAVLSIGGVVFSAVIQGSEVTDRGAEQLDVSGDTLTFTIENEIGDITIEAGESDVIAVDYLKRAYGISRDEARSRLDDVTVRLEETGEGQVLLSVDRPGGRFSLARVDSVDLVVTLPSDMVYDLNVKATVGALRVEEEVQVSQIDADIAWAGEIAFNGVITEDMADSHLRTGLGTVSLAVPEGVFLRVEAETAVGDISVDPSLDAGNVEQQDNMARKQWSGTFGEESGSPPVLQIAVDGGDIRINPQ